MFLWICGICEYGICECGICAYVYIHICHYALHETWTRGVFILPDEYWWIGCGGPAPKYLVPSETLLGSFGDIIYSSFGNTLIAVWGGPLQYTEGFEMYLGLETSILLMICYMLSEWLSMRFTVLSGNTIYTGIPIIWLSVLCHMHSAFAYVTYWVLYSQIFLHCRGYWCYVS